ncbi:FGGY-family carbohydrate kinase, partial [Aerococcus urinaeequi]
ATLQSIAYQVRDITDTMNKDTGIDIPLLKVDGGAAMNGYLMQFQSDITGIEIARAANLETTALGAAYLAGLAVGYWKDIDELKSFTQPGQTFEPKMNDSHKEDLYAGWTNAVRATRAYSQYFKEEAND